VAQLAEADIMVGSTRIAGRLQVDAGLIRSEAGPLEPRLVVPVAIELSNRPADQMLALTHLTGHLNPPLSGSHSQRRWIHGLGRGGNTVRDKSTGLEAAA
jgi:hypothetical protein